VVESADWRGTRLIFIESVRFPRRRSIPGMAE
jgi:hypothetical protein